jgi:hypothetical protein
MGEAGERHTLVVFYDARFRYVNHDLYDRSGRPEGTSGY